MAVADQELTFSRSNDATTADEAATAVDRYAYDVDVDDDTRAHAEDVMQGYRDRLMNWTESYPHREEEYVTRMQAAGLMPDAGGPSPQIGGPILPGGYQYWNTLTAGPFQLFGNPPYRPGKIIAGGELAFFIAVIWVNPNNSPGGGLPGTVVLGSRGYNAFFDTFNVSDVTNVTNFTVNDAFSGPADVVTLIPWFFVPPDPGPQPKIFETSFAVDIVEPGQPFASLATWHIDPDLEPGFLGLPPVPPQLQHDIPARFLVYSES